MKNFDKKLSGIYAVTDPKLTRSGDVLADIKSLCEGGASLVQLREKDLSDEDFLDLAIKGKKITENFPEILFIINDNIEVALKSGADGVHLGQGDDGIKKARKILGKSAIIGQSVQTADMLEKSKKLPLDYIGVGAIFDTNTHNTKYRLGLTGLKKMVENSPFPVFAIGGIHKDNFEDVLAQNPAGIAMVSELVGAVDVQNHTAKFVKFFL